MILVTGAAGFIGAQVLGALLQRGRRAIGLDNFNAHYAVTLKRDRVARLVQPFDGQVLAVDCAQRDALAAVFSEHRVEKVIHLAAQAGVRNSIAHPGAYTVSNLVGFANMLECCRHAGVAHLVYASSSSVYGNHGAVPWDEDHDVSHPVSYYAATKVANEALAHSYAHLYRLPCTALRFFTVYGPWGRPDMAPFLFTKAILAGEPIQVFNHGRMQRDFTYIDDIVQAVCALVDKPATPDAAFRAAAPSRATSDAPHRIFNIGNHAPVELNTFIGLLEESLGRPAQRHGMEMQAGDVVRTHASTRRLADWIGFSPSTPLAEGVRRFAAWYTGYYGMGSMPAHDRHPLGEGT